MKNFKRILTTLMAVLLLCGTMSALADVEVTLDAPRDIDAIDLGIFPEAFGLSDGLSLVEEAPGAACAVSNAEEEAPTDIYSTFTMNVGENKYLVPVQSSSTGRFSVTSVSSDPNIVEARGRRVKARAPGRCIVTLTIVFDRRRSEPVVRKYDITVAGGPTLAANGKTLEADEGLRLKVRETIRLEVMYLNALGVKSWSSSDPEILKIVTKGAVCYFIPLKPGTCTITVRLDDGEKLTCKVTVTAKAKKR